MTYLSELSHQVRGDVPSFRRVEGTIFRIPIERCEGALPCRLLPGHMGIKRFFLIDESGLQRCSEIRLLGQHSPWNFVVLTGYAIPTDWSFHHLRTTGKPSSKSIQASTLCAFSPFVSGMTCCTIVVRSCSKITSPVLPRAQQSFIVLCRPSEGIGGFAAYFAFASHPTRSRYEASSNDIDCGITLLKASDSLMELISGSADNPASTACGRDCTVVGANPWAETG